MSGGRNEAPQEFAEIVRESDHFPRRRRVKWSHPNANERKHPIKRGPNFRPKRPEGVLESISWMDDLMEFL
jgi:hypothetical protein